jgi:Fe2+ transport system protein FeoA
MKTLNQIKPKQKVTIVSVCNCSDGMCNRLKCLGVDVGNEVEILRKGWFGPIHFRIGMTELFMRNKNAKCIEVE